MWISKINIFRDADAGLPRKCGKCQLWGSRSPRRNEEIERSLRHWRERMKRRSSVKRHSFDRQLHPAWPARAKWPKTPKTKNRDSELRKRARGLKTPAFNSCKNRCLGGLRSVWGHLGVRNRPSHKADLGPWKTQQELKHVWAYMPHTNGCTHRQPRAESSSMEQKLTLISGSFQS